MEPAAHAAPVDAPFRSWARRWSSVPGLAVAGFLIGWVGPSAAATPAFDDLAPLVSHDGVAQLSWSGPPADYEVRLEQGERARVVYRGSLPSAHLSGLLEGDYAVRVREGGVASPWSAAKPILVRHHPLPLVLGLMGLGLLAFVGTVVVVLHSSRVSRARSSTRSA
jgi:hypothetical protein